MEPNAHYFVLLVVGLLSAQRSNSLPTSTALVPVQCEEDGYCPGTNFPEKLIINNRFIQCDVVPQPKKNCCLPQEKHLACYDIKVDGKLLNFDPSSWSSSTDITELCRIMVEYQGEELGAYAKVTIDGTSGGYISYNYGAFQELEQPSGRHIKDLACGISGEWPGKRLPDDQRPTSPPKEAEPSKTDKAEDADEEQEVDEKKGEQATTEPAENAEVTVQPDVEIEQN